MEVACRLTSVGVLHVSESFCIVSSCAPGRTISYARPPLFLSEFGSSMRAVYSRE
jgi:hypothetical protein